ncbi:MAG TPA: 2-C-methyl-D-erythritol 4-phosphate cytidylyltransferase [bacterium]|nr:2-C-methyl-D-erythritol 4-phosphate cytidylyltransferase [bacterium]
MSTPLFRPWAAILVAAGRSTRLKSPVPKPFLKLDRRRTLLDCCLDSFKKVKGLACVVVVTQPDHLEKAIDHLYRRGLAGIACVGGKEREDSVLQGLLVVPKGIRTVLVHDAARPFVTPRLVQSVLEEALRSGAAIPGLPVKDTLKETLRGRVVRTLDRDSVRAAQTPQGFRADLLRRAFLKAADRRSKFTDDAAVAEAAGFPVRLVEGDPLNFKVTTPDDLARARALARGRI